MHAVHLWGQVLVTIQPWSLAMMQRGITEHYRESNLVLSKLNDSRADALTITL